MAAAVQADLAECTRKQKEAAERASEFEKQWVAESKLRKDLHNQLQVRTLTPALTPPLSLTPNLTLTLTLTGARGQPARLLPRAPRAAE